MRCPDGQRDRRRPSEEQELLASLQERNPQIEPPLPGPGSPNRSGPDQREQWSDGQKDEKGEKRGAAQPGRETPPGDQQKQGHGQGSDVPCPAHGPAQRDERSGWSHKPTKGQQGQPSSLQDKHLNDQDHRCCRSQYLPVATQPAECHRGRSCPGPLQEIQPLAELIPSLDRTPGHHSGHRQKANDNARPAVQATADDCDLRKRFRPQYHRREKEGPAEQTPTDPDDPLVC